MRYVCFRGLGTIAPGFQMETRDEEKCVRLQTANVEQRWEANQWRRAENAVGRVQLSVPTVTGKARRTTEAGRPTGGSASSALDLARRSVACATAKEQSDPYAPAAGSPEVRRALHLLVPVPKVQLTVSAFPAMSCGSMTCVAVRQSRVNGRPWKGDRRRRLLSRTTTCCGGTCPQ
jgi:hypothetical protein